MGRLVLLAAGFAYMVLLIEAVRAAVAWWHGEASPGTIDYLLLGALPVLVWIWWRYFSMFRRDCSRAACLLPEDRDGPQPGSGA